MDAFPLHLNHTSPPELTARLFVGLVAGLLATAVMNIPMKRLREGQTPPFVVARAFTGDELVEVSGGFASGLHYVIGMLTGLLFTLVSVGFERLLPADLLFAGVGLPVYPYLAALVVTFLFLFGFFAYVILPAFGDSARNRADRVRRHWGISTAVYTVALALAVPVVIALFT